MTSCGARCISFILASTIFPLSIGSASAAGQGQVASPETGPCPNLSGEYRFWGKTESEGREVSISFLQQLIRPSRQGVQWIRVAGTQEPSEFRVSFLDDSSKAIGNDVRIVIRCNEGKWEEKKSFEGNSDGTLVKGNRTWTYCLDDRGAMIVEVEEISSSRYFPGISSGPGSARRSARFTRR
jgi:hypothetical protein